LRDVGGFAVAVSGSEHCCTVEGETRTWLSRGRLYPLAGHMLMAVLNIFNFELCSEHLMSDSVLSPKENLLLYLHRHLT